MEEKRDLNNVARRVLLLYQEAYEELKESVFETVVQQGSACELGHVEQADAALSGETKNITHVLLLGDEEHLHALLPKVIGGAITLGLLPTPGNRRLCKLFDIPLDVEAAVALALGETPQKIDQLYCNGEPVICGVTIGHVPFAGTHGCAHSPAFPERFGLFADALRALVSLRPLTLTVETSGNDAFTSAVSGVVVVEHDTSALAARLANTALSSQDGRISALFAAPDSLLSYVGFLWRYFTSDVTKSGKLPPHTGFVKSERLTITTDMPVGAIVDGRTVVAQRFEFTLQSKALQINCGEKYRERYLGQAEEKDSFKTEQLPKGEHALAALQKKLPFFSHASEESFADLFVQLRRNSSMRWSFFVLMFLSTMIASLGMLLNSASIVIGAMILAPLMGPIIALSMGLMRNETEMILASLKTIAFGVLLALCVAAVVASSFGESIMTPEIQGRLTPNLLDLVVAVMAGIAGAYAQAKEDVAATLPGVAIAVALVPPLCVAGIGLGWMDTVIMQGAMLLFVTNLVGISLAASLTFLFLGYAPFSRATKGIVLSSVITAVVAAPLAFAYLQMRYQHSIVKELTRYPYAIGVKEVCFENVSTLMGSRKHLEVHADAVSESMLDSDEIVALKQQVSVRVQQEVTLNISMRIRY